VAAITLAKDLDTAVRDALAWTGPSVLDDLARVEALTTLTAQLALT
jgi:hypothetical protein